jgi:hypothetical protein
MPNPKMKSSLRCLIIVAGIALLMFCCWLAFMAHACAGDSAANTCGIWISLLLFFLSPFFGWKAWRGSKACGIILFAGILFIIWLPPWVIAGFPEMLVVSGAAVFCGHGFIRLMSQP